LFPVVVRADRAISHYTITSGTTLNGQKTSIVTDLGDNMWLLGVVDKNQLVMVKVKVTGRMTWVWMGTRFDDQYSVACAKHETFTEACFKGTDPKANIVPIDLHTSEAESVWIVTRNTTLDGKNVTLILDLGDDIYIVGRVDGKLLITVKIKVTGPRTAIWMETRMDSDFSDDCTDPSNFEEACFRGANPRKNIAPINVWATKAASHYHLAAKTLVNGKKAQLVLDLGGNVFIVAIVEDESLIMVKMKIVGPTSALWIGTRVDDNFDKACGMQETFSEDCFKGEDPETMDDPVEIEAVDDTSQ